MRWKSNHLIQSPASDGGSTQELDICIWIGVWIADQFRRMRSNFYASFFGEKEYLQPNEMAPSRWALAVSLNFPILLVFGRTNYLNFHLGIIKQFNLIGTDLWNKYTNLIIHPRAMATNRCRSCCIPMYMNLYKHIQLNNFQLVFTTNHE